MQIKEKSFIKYVLALTIFGTSGLVVHFINLPTPFTVSVRACLGVVVILLVMAFTKHKIKFADIRRNLILLIISGIALAVNWVTLYESFKHVGVSVGTLLNYMSPVFLVVIAPFIFKEMPSLKKVICILAALGGMVLITVSSNNGAHQRIEWIGMVLGIASALCYSIVLVCNKKIQNIKMMDRTLFQLITTIVIMLPYMFITTDLGDIHLDTTKIILLLILGIVHTGIAYLLFFEPMSVLSAQTLAILSYLDPVISVVL